MIVVKRSSQKWRVYTGKVARGLWDAEIIHQPQFPNMVTLFKTGEPAREIHGIDADMAFDNALSAI